MIYGLVDDGLSGTEDLIKICELQKQLWTIFFIFMIAQPLMLFFVVGAVQAWRLGLTRSSPVNGAWLPEKALLRFHRREVSNIIILVLAMTDILSLRAVRRIRYPG